MARVGVVKAARKSPGKCGRCGDVIAAGSSYRHWAFRYGGKRIRLFMEEDCDRFELTRLALNAAQIERYSPPPNPVKLTDSRSDGYRRRFGEESWELDALDPNVLAALVRNAVEGMRDQDLWDEAVEKEEAHRAGLTLASSRWADVASFLEEKSA